MERPSGTVTFLFTDIEGSTRRWDTDTHDMSEALARHDEVLRSAIEAHGGWLFKHTGDGVVAAFSSPTAAIEAAIAAQRELQLPVRMGIATGEAELRGDDYFGPPLNEAARIMGAGHSGQILVAAGTAAIEKGIELLDLGEHRLRDISRSQHLFQARADGLREAFPPLRTLDTIPGNLPAQLTSFIGREEEVERVAALLQEHRLVTLTGVGGVGKTRLALQVAGQQAPDLDGGAWLVELAPIGDPASVPHAVAGTFGVTKRPGMTLTESIAASLDRRDVLIVLDNAEHVIGAVADLAGHLLEHSSSVSILATSRETLMIDGERAWTVRSLGFKSGADQAAVALFVDRAVAVASDFAPSEPELQVVREICQRLDGIPLAIELAAARMRSMTPMQIRDRLGERFRLLTGGPRRAQERHQTLRQAVQWSYDLLDETEKRVLARSSVFAGGFTLQAAEAVCAGESGDEFDVLDLLDSLARKSLVTVDRSADEARYGLLETIRQFGEEQLGTYGTGTSARTAHARLFAGAARAARERWESAEFAAAGDWFELELDNLRTAFRWALEAGQLDLAADIAVSSDAPVADRCNIEIVDWAIGALGAAREAGTHRLGDLLSVASGCGIYGRLDEGRRYAEEALSYYASGPSGSRSLTPWVVLTLAAWREERLEDAINFAKQGFELPEDQKVGLCGIWLTLAYVNADKTADAMRVAKELEGRAAGPAGPLARSYVHHAMGWALRFSDPSASALEFERAADVLEFGDVLNEEAAAQRRAPVSSAMAAAARGYQAQLHAVHSPPREALQTFDRVFSSLAELESSALGLPLAYFCILLDRLEQHEAIAMLQGVAAPWIRILPADVQVFQETVDRVRSALGERVFQEIHERGAGMTLREAAAFALDQIAELLEKLDDRRVETI